MKITVRESKKNEGLTIQSWFEFKGAVGNSEFDLAEVRELLRGRFGQSTRVDEERRGNDWIVAVVYRRFAPDDIRWALDNLPAFSSCAINGPAYI